MIHLEGPIPFILTELTQLMADAEEVDVGEWHAMDVRNRPELVSWELQNVVFAVPLPRTLFQLQDQVKPNLPWAEEHFQERVGGEPLNPPPSHVDWPWANANEQHMDGGVFSHSYPERFWPRFAGDEDGQKNHGIRYPYGDLQDLKEVLARNPDTRQAYLPIWFPEDLYAANGARARVPCSLGYHFLVRQDKLHVAYFIRSCDWFRYFRDDLYMAGRLAQWVLNELKRDEKLAALRSPEEDLLRWQGIEPGDLTMFIGSLHYFTGDRKKVLREAGR